MSFENIKCKKDIKCKSSDGYIFWEINRGVIMENYMEFFVNIKFWYYLVF